MKDLALYAWDISVALGIFGYGLIGMRLLGLRRSSLAVAGVLGVSLWIALGGVLNLLHLLRPSVFFSLVAIGIVLLAAELLLRRREPQTPPATTPFSPLTKLAVAAAVLLILTLVVGAMRPRHWGVDDVQGYLALGVQTAQTHALQPDPFSERRVNVGVGGGIFLDALMFATGDLRAMNFIDTGFGYALYALAVWTLGRRWKLHPLAIAFTVLCLPLAPLFKINLTIVDLSAAAFLALLLLLTEAPEDKPFTVGRVLALGLIIGANLTTKTPNIVFILPMLLGVVLLYRLFRAPHNPLLPLFYALLVALAVFVPWSIATRANVGTYLYPVLGLGTHITAFHLIWPQSRTGDWPQMLLLTAPNLTLLALCFAVVWNLTRHWTAAPRAAVIAYIAAALIALPICIKGLGGEDADRYTAPLVIPVFFLTLLIVLAAWQRSPSLIQQPASPLWRIAGVLTLLAAGLYTVLFIDIRLMWLFETKTVLYEAFGKLPRHQIATVSLIDGPALQKEFADWARIQNTIPPGATALDFTNRSFHDDFRRNPIFIADIPGMASPPPGLPLDSSPAVQRQFLVDHGVDYLIYERKTALTCAYPVLGLSTVDWPSFFRNQSQHFTLRYLLANETFTHAYGAWTVVDYEVACHERNIAEQIVDSSPQVYNDGNFVIARLH
jgi:hypothetical protein